MKKLTQLLIWPLLLISTLATATTVTPAAVEKQLAEAVLVADIEVLSQEVRPHPQFAAITLSVAEVTSIQRTTEDSVRLRDWITIVTPGGELNGRGTVYSGFPKPYRTKKYRAHLRRSLLIPGAYEVAGYDQGLVSLNGERKYSRNRTDGSNGDGTGSFLFWDERSLPIPYFVSGKSFDGHPDYVAAIDASFKTWRDIADIKIEFLSLGCSQAMQNENDGINNVILIRSNWGFDAAAIAITRNFYVADTSERSGMILDTDILLNEVDHDFTTTGKAGSHDLQNILTHEIGHFLGLGHEVAPFSSGLDETMYALATPNETKKRILKTADLAGIHAAYAGVADKFSAPRTFCEVGNNAKGCSAVHDGETNPLGAMEFVLFLVATLGAGKFLMRKQLI